MKANNFTLDAYCQRIGYQGEVGANLDTLTQLMRHQLFSVPFENCQSASKFDQVSALKFDHPRT
jgi:arylamine N-acetyltransferase